MISQREILWRKGKSGLKVGALGIVAFGGIGIWSGNDKFFEQFIAPLLTKVDPEFSHRAAVTLARFHLQKRGMTDDPPNLRANLGSLVVSNPIGIAAGFDKNAECMSGLRRTGYGWVEIGSVTPIPQEGNAKPRVFRLPQDKAVINRYGFNNDGHEQVYMRVQEFKSQHPDYIVGVNLGANKESPNRISDYCKGIERFSNTADYFVINISSPNTPNLRDLQKSETLPELLQNVMYTRDNQTRRVPVFLKVAPDITDADIKSICKTVLSEGTKIDGIIISNTTITRDDLESDPKVTQESGGLSGKPLERASTILVAKFYSELNGQIPIIGVGGIWDGKDAFAKIQAGASAVQIYSVVAYKGLGVVNAMKKELSEILTKNGYKSVAEAVGSRHAESQTPVTKTKSSSAAV
ncbi:Dihydroorotate dehydrogenase (quinone), mitochondrial [Orchesella cincta]|uniref:Dihydroorotate dehydrogenase (quinone), mitochondrial n=1 Tax=Orchesella cincta TaxID=48709 RepID=A0A1D2N6V8_ORCCI|nr:Dihydroorotate dehydrogenase (quinone), mitochondrial [Orchesella cincta]